MFTEKQTLAQLFWDPFLDFPLFNTIDFSVYVSNFLVPDMINIVNKESMHVWRPVRDEVWQPIVNTIQDKHEGITLLWTNLGSCFSSMLFTNQNIVFNSK